MTSNINFALIPILVVSLSQFSFSFGDDSTPTPEVHLMIVLPYDRIPIVRVTCKLQHGLPLLSVTLVIDQEFLFYAGITNDAYVCDAQWGDVSTFFIAYDPLVFDKGHTIVYWLIRDDGLFKSWDKINWMFIGGWQNNSLSNGFHPVSTGSVYESTLKKRSFFLPRHFKLTTSEQDFTMS
ncbi:hypothetical protein FXO38_03905 [Capsicum annuum]|nr:hypothetical protein FXO37_12506 [Capsicum annuum]KAF3677238.1 hypothetical protein FXO38_03905 [Capsicum annuum]